MGGTSQGYSVRYTLKGNLAAGDDIVISVENVKSFKFVESLIEPGILGEFNFIDISDTVTKLPILGNETFEVQVRFNDIERVIEFGISDVRLIGVTTEAKEYVFYLTQKEFFDTDQMRFSKSYIDMSPSTIVTDILKYKFMLPSNRMNVETTMDTIHYIVPNITPTKAILSMANLSRRATSPDDGMFLFYSAFDSDNINGTKVTPMFNFISMASLIEQEYDNETEPYLLNSISSVYKNAIFKEDARISLYNNDVLSRGFGGRTVHNIDIMNKVVNITTRKYSDYITDKPFLGKYALHNVNDIDNKESAIRFSGHFNNQLVSNEINTAFRRLFSGIMVKDIYIPGSFDVYAGKVIKYQENYDDSNHVYNRLSTGSWLVKEVVHRFEQNGDYKQKLTIIKNALSDMDDVSGIQILPKGKV